MVDKAAGTNGQFLQGFLLNVVVGLVLLLVNFPRFIERTVSESTDNAGLQALLLTPVSGVQALLTTVLGENPEPFFRTALSVSVFLFWGFLALVALLAMRRRDGVLPLVVAGGLVTGYIALHLVAWFVALVLMAVGVTLDVGVWLFGITTAVVMFLFKFGLPLGAIALVAYLLYRYRRRWLGILGSAIGLALVLYVLAKVGPAVLHWLIGLTNWIGKGLMWVLTPVFAVLAFIFAAIFLLGGGLLALAIMGNLVIAQLRAGLFAGRDRKSLSLASFAIGAAASLIALACVASPGPAADFNYALAESLWPFGDQLRAAASGPGEGAIGLFQAILPEKVREFALLHLTNAKAPAVDSIILAIAVLLSALSIARELVIKNTLGVRNVPIYFYPREYFSIVAGVFLGVVVLFAQGLSESSS
jgi:hypothetical protein